MSKSFEKLTKDLASGMSRRNSLKRFLGGLGAGAAALLTGRNAFAGGSDLDVCIDHCRIALGVYSSGATFGACMAASAQCPPGQCAIPMNLNGTTPGDFGQIEWICSGPIVTPR